MLKTKIKEYREKAGLKQVELAELVSSRRETIVHLENGRYNPSLKLAMDIAKVFHVTVEDLFEFVDDEKGGSKASRASQRQVNGLRPPLTAPPVLAGG